MHRYNSDIDAAVARRTRPPASFDLDVDEAAGRYSLYLIHWPLIGNAPLREEIRERGIALYAKSQPITRPPDAIVRRPHTCLYRLPASAFVIFEEYIPRQERLACRAPRFAGECAVCGHQLGERGLRRDVR